MHITSTLAAGVQALRDGQADEAARLFDEACADQAFATQSDLRDLYARACSLHAQALLFAGRPAQARKPLRRALDLLESLHDEAGLQEVKELERQIGEAMAEDFAGMARRREQHALARRSISEVLDGVDSPSTRAELLVKWSLGAFADGRQQQAAQAAYQAIDQARQGADLKHEVLARIALASIEPMSAVSHLESARARADSANEFNLVGAVARAADQAGLTLPSPDPLHEQD